MTNDSLLAHNESPELFTKKRNLPQSTYDTFPTPIQDLIMSYLDGDIAISKQANYGTNSISTLFECGSKEKYYDKLAFAALLGHVVRGEQDKAEAIIRINPELLFKSGTVKDLAGNTYINYSPCQLACYAQDENIIKMMKSYLDEKGKRQFNLILMDANEEYEKQEPYDLSELVAVIDGGNARQKQQVLDAFKKRFEPREIKNEKSFNIKNIQKAFEVYVKNYYPWLPEQCALLWCEVIGFYQRSLPACYAQAFCQGLYHVTDGNKTLERELKLSGGELFYSMDVKKQEGLGFDYGIISCLDSSRDDCLRKGIPHSGGWKRVEICGALLEKLIKQKREACIRLCNVEIVECKP